jgi:ATP/maltotriose-dependent transcriptional regulator MalT
MTMSFLLHDLPGEIESAELGGQVKPTLRRQRVSRSASEAIIADKVRIPEAGGTINRPRLVELIEKSVELYGATLISGRAGTGKTVLAADHARRHKNATWHTFEPADSDWREFSNAFVHSLTGRKAGRLKISKIESPDEATISELLTYCLGRVARQRRPLPRLIVFDNVHHLFDAPWFGEFFRQLIISLSDDVRLLMLCRSKPSAPLWRLRSKQMLNVIDENVLDFTQSEARRFARQLGLPPDAADEALRASFGRASTLSKILIQAAADYHSRRSGVSS